MDALALVSKSIAVYGVDYVSTFSGASISSHKVKCTMKKHSMKEEICMETKHEEWGVYGKSCILS